MANNDLRESFPTPDDPRFEVDLSNVYSQYFLYSRAEVVAVLRSVMQKGALITVHFDQGQSFFLTSIAALRPDEAEIVFDAGNDSEMNARALRADELIFTAVVDKVKIQFGLASLRRADYQGHPALVGAIPDRLLRLQRREFFRLATSMANPVRLRGTIGPDGRDIDVPLADISGGGVGLMVPPDLAGLLESGQMLENCKIMLPNEGLLIADLCVRNMFDVTNRGGLRHVRVGCEFVRLPAARLAAVQRYILRVERERKARMSG
ncbi:MAG: flagellar brake protein [Candidatus Accumulibacter sp.]|jgi:c-di-GMP-binding flagellar brake protein YcgR|nr:flagellar brake protein [Accumulibacter sp.]